MATAQLSTLALTFFAGDRASTAGIATTAFNPLARPGELVVVLARGDTSSLSGKLANKLAVEHFTEAVLDVGIAAAPVDAAASEAAQSFGSVVHKPRAVALLEAGFERANQQIYAFGHKLAAGGTLATSIIALAISQGELAAARVGTGDVKFRRDGEDSWLFEAPDPASTTASKLTAGAFNGTVLVGAHRQLPVEFLHLEIIADDMIELYAAASDVAAYASWRITIGPATVFLDEVFRR